MNTHTKIWPAVAVLALGVTLSWFHLTGPDPLPDTAGKKGDAPRAAIPNRVDDRRAMDAELSELRTVLASLRDTVQRLQVSVERTRSRAEASDTLAQALRDRILVLEESLPVSVFDTPGSDSGFDTTPAEPPVPDPDGRTAAEAEPDPIEAAAQRFYAERIDDRKTGEVVSLIEQQMAQGALGGSDLISTACNGATCRTVVQHNSGEDALQFDLDFPSVVGAQFDSFVTRRTDLGDGLYETEIYMGRDIGH